MNTFKTRPPLSPGTLVKFKNDKKSLLLVLQVNTLNSCEGETNVYCYNLKAHERIHCERRELWSTKKVVQLETRAERFEKHEVEYAKKLYEKGDFETLIRKNLFTKYFRTTFNQEQTN